MPQIEVIYENGVLRPLGKMPESVQDHQRLWITIEAPNQQCWTSPPGPFADMDSVREQLAKIPGTIAEAVIADRRRD